MAVLPLLAKNVPGQLRPLNILRDLPAVADLIDICFVGHLDEDGLQSVQQMRRSGQDRNFLNWANRMIDSLSLPLSGFVWEENGNIIGNVSLVPYRHSRRLYYLIANVAVHPDYRRRGIGRMLTQAAIERACAKGAAEIWLQVRDNNAGAICLYQELGFRERARRTFWRWSGEIIPPSGPLLPIVRRRPKDWPEQQKYLRRLYPALLDWYQPLPWRLLHPGLLYALQRFVLEEETRHWVIHQPTGLTCLTWLPTNGHYDMLLLAAPPIGAEAAIHDLLLHSQNMLRHRRKGLALELPAEEYSQAIQSAGFYIHRTLLWMKLEYENARFPSKA
ncbi:MAG: GNAT family N-acetyltransferase [Anaerolineales bacterium]|nr:GNAT family N-acetyltransferase [Anaerolineales bacterium]MCX7608564.1 GNAT family N-acetyltransferase [Anaerolineales bacterium]MDW8227368.1 GNAT family N-acetyltransferase [Anaerolineales bacterium]